MLIAYVAARASRRALARMWLHPDAEADVVNMHLPDLRPTVVDALPRCCLPCYDAVVALLGKLGREWAGAAFLRCLRCANPPFPPPVSLPAGAGVVVLIGAGLCMKVSAAVSGGA